VVPSQQGGEAAGNDARTGASAPQAPGDVSSQRKPAAIAAGIALLVIVVMVAVMSRPEERNENTLHEVEAVVTYIDPATRTLGVQIPDPHRDATLDVSGEVPADCEITINDESATLADLRAGDQARIWGRLLPIEGQERRRPVPKAIRVTR
jgi:hypothetical protein